MFQKICIFYFSILNILYKQKLFSFLIYLKSYFSFLILFSKEMRKNVSN